MGDDIFTALIQGGDTLAQRVREYSQRRIESALAQAKQTIDIRVEQESETKAVSLATKMLLDSQQWVQLQQQRSKQKQQAIELVKLTLLWVGSWVSSGFSGVLFYLISAIVFGGWAFVAGVNYPAKIPCPSEQSFCYKLRWDKSTVVTPRNIQQHLPKKFHKNLGK